jgi:predicted ribonuclease YlaK
MAIIHSKPVFKKIRNARRAHKPQEFVDMEVQRQAKRLSRQQKRLEKETGLMNVISINDTIARQKVVRYQDIKVLEPLTDTQADFFEAWESNAADAYVLYGSAGTGKTMMALYHAILDVLNPELPDYQKVIIVRSSVQSRNIGFLPGDTDEKMEAFEAPYHGIMSDLTGKKDAYEKLKDMGKIEFVSSSFLRGSTFNNAIIIIDESQDLNWHEIKTIATRMGKFSKMIWCGDSAQNDLIYAKNDVSGFREFIEVSRQMPSFRNFKFTTDDIVRSGFVKEWLITCEKLGL